MQLIKTIGRKPLELTGKTFNGIRVIKRYGSIFDKSAWLCLCSCGNEFVAVGTTLARGGIKGCSKCLKQRRTEAATKHGCVGTKEYSTYIGMKGRCRNPNNKRFSRYGGRGIKVCDRWEKSFVAFIADMGKAPSDKHTIERIDIDGNYCPENCKWATIEEQAKNRSNNHYITINGETMTMMDWSRKTGICRTVLLKRIKRGLSGEALIEKHYPKKITAFGFTGTIAEWGRRAGIKASTIAARIRDYGFNSKQAVSRIPA